jgi:serine/threonine protein kinase
MAKKALSWSDLRLIEELGHGQAGSVSRAELLQEVGGLPRGASVAVKRYKAWVMEQEGQMERIIREVEIGRSLNHPHIVRTLTLIFEESGRPALVMVYYRGKTLQCILEGQRTSESPMSPEEALRILGPLADALATLHARGVVHRDVKPANIMITEMAQS